MVTKSKKARPITLETVESLYAVVITIDGRRKKVSDVADYDTAREMAADINCGSQFSGWRARVRRAIIQVGG
jgi:hypothetical protein